VGKFPGVRYVVYEGCVLTTSTDEAEILYVTDDVRTAIAYATTHQGVVYSYDVTEAEEYINETFVYDGTTA
jgi:hypothetical protein